MSDGITGRDWSETEVALCVDAYLEHLKLDLEGRSFNKAQLYRDLAAQTGRSPSSIEFKFQNISAVLNELGRPWISGLAPLANYQQLLAETIGARGGVIKNLDDVPTEDVFEDLASVFIEAPPERASKPSQLPDYMERLIRKFDPVERDMHNRKLGENGERLIFEYEKRALVAFDRSDLAKKVRWISKEEGDGAGYDILSFDDRGEKKFVEVKTTTGGNRTPFFISRNEHAFANEERERYHLVRLFDFRRTPRAFEIHGELEKFVRLSTETYRADFRA
jgi:hypothetical protein